MTTTTVKDGRFFLYYAWFLLIFVIGSFGGKAIFDTEDLPPITYLHHMHAVTMGAWCLLFALQPTLINRGHYRLHKRLGRLSPLVVIAFISIAIPISLLNWTRTGDPLVVTANTVNFILFISLYVAAIRWHHQASTHKRLMLYATLTLMGPAVGRVPDIFDQSPFLGAPITFALLLAPLANDIISHRRVHAATWIGFTLAVLAIPLILVLSGYPAWIDLLEALLGTPSGNGQ